MSRVIALLLVLISACAHDQLRESVRGLPRPASTRRAFEGIHGVGGPSGVVLISDNAVAWASRWEMLGQAQERIEASYFIVAPDVFGLAFIAHLYERALHGVHVRLLVDAKGTGPLLGDVNASDTLGELASADADVLVYNPPLTQVAASLVEGSTVPLMAASHDKILVVDHAWGMAGGRNIGAQYFNNQEENRAAMFDTDLLIDAPAAADELVRIARSRAVHQRIEPRDQLATHDVLLMIYGAMDAWLRGTVPEEPYEDAVWALEAKGIAQLDGLPDRTVRDFVREQLKDLAAAHSLYKSVPVGPLPRHQAEVVVVNVDSRAEKKSDNYANDALLKAIGAARERILLQSPYFMLTPRILAALSRAGHRGVEIVVLTNGPSSSDNNASQAMFIDTWPELEARVPHLRIFVAADDQMLHAKRAIFDDDLSLVGSYNLDPLSAHMNSEVVVGVWSREVNAANRGEIEARLDSGNVFEYRIRRDKDGHPLRDHDGVLVVEFGPRDHVPEEQIAKLEHLKHVLVGIRGLWDFEWVVF